MNHANGSTRPGAFRQRWGRKKGGGRRARHRKTPYHFQPGYALITGTVRHCYVHPEREAILWEKNTQDASYKRPVCAECAE